jgi:hypothetical protein
MTSSKQEQEDQRREEKRRLVRRTLYHIRDRDRNFQNAAAELIRAIRYLRLRNQEVALMNTLVRLQICFRIRDGDTDSSTREILIQWNNNKRRG